MPVMGVSQFERFFREVASLDVDKADIGRFEETIDRVVYDLLVRGVETAKSNDRDVVLPFDLPVTRGLRENIRLFQRLDSEVLVEPFLERLARRPPLDAVISDDTEAMLPMVLGGAGVALARTFTLLDTNVRNPQTAQWERARRLMELLL